MEGGLISLMSQRCKIPIAPLINLETLQSSQPLSFIFNLREARISIFANGDEFLKTNNGFLVAFYHTLK